MKNLIFTLLGLFIGTALFGQVTNDNHVNYQINVKHVKTGIDDTECIDEPAGTTGCIFNDNEEWKFLANFEVGSSCPNSSPYDMSKTIYGDNKITKTYNENVLKVLNTDNYSYRYYFRLDESDTHESVAGGGNDYLFFTCSSNSVNVPYDDMGVWSTHFVVNGQYGHEVAYQDMYRFNKGDNFANALTFGTVSNGQTKTHKNNSSEPPTYADSDLGYSDSYDDANTTDDPDVCYKFTLSECLNMEIKNIHSGSNVKLHLVEMGASNSYTHKSTINAGSTYTQYLPAGDYGIIAEALSGVRVFEIQLKALNAAVVNPGTIALSGPIAIPAGSNHPGSLNNAGSATGYNTYKWEKSVNNSSNWLALSGSNSYYYLPVLTETFYYRRCAVNTVCNIQECTPGIKVQALPLNGKIEGHVYAPGTTNGIPGITITVTPPSGIIGGTLAPSSYTATTIAGGSYQVPGIYYGPDNSPNPDPNFTVTPSYSDHVFGPSSQTRTLSPNNFIQSAVDFDDETSFDLFGKITQNGCGLPNVDIFLNNSKLGLSDINGNYYLSIPEIGNHTIRPELAGHNFDYSTGTAGEVTLYITDDITIPDFESQNMQNITGHFLAGCDAYIGQANIKLIGEGGCPVINITTAQATGYFSQNIPAKKYTVELTSYTPSGSVSYTSGDVTGFFASSFNLDMIESDTIFDFIYHPTPRIVVSGIPALPSCGFLYPVIEQVVPVPLTINIYEGSGTCPVDTGTLTITDAISDLVTDSVIHFVNGVVDYAMIPGGPNLTGDHLKNIYLAAMDTFNQLTVRSDDMLVTGFRARNTTFATVSPEIPMFILHDPPGDNSYSELSTGQTIETASSFSTQFGGSVGAWAKVKYQQEALITETWGEVSVGVTVGGSVKSTENFVTSLSTTQSFKTSDSDKVIGDKGDVFIGGALNLLYAVSDVIDFDESRCEATIDQELVIDNEGFETTYIYSEGHIRSNVIPDLELFRDNTSNPDTMELYQDQIAVWEQLLAMNDLNKSSAIFVDNFSINGGNTLSSSTTASNTTKTSIEFSQFVNVDIAAEAGVTFLKTATIAGGAKINLRLDFGQSSSSATTNAVTTGYTIHDDDIQDEYTFDVLTDPLYGTPVFKLLAGESSCPYVPTTAIIDAGAISTNVPTLYEVPPSSQAQFTFTLSNISETNATRFYRLEFNQGSNPDGAIVTIGGAPVTDPIDYQLAPFTTQNVTVRVEKASVSNVYAYESLEFYLYPACDPYAGATEVLESQKISVFFESPCSNISLPEPLAGWTSSGFTANAIDVRINGYTVSDLDQVKLEYSPASANSWNTIKVYNPGDLNTSVNAGTTFNWNTNALPTGMYDIRAKLICGTDIFYSSRTTGYVDNVAPEIVGIPKPLDSEYDSTEDELSVLFNEDINCAELSASNVLLLNTFTNAQYTTTLSCVDNQLIIVPELDLAALTPAPYKILIQGVKDLYGNEQMDSITWEFMVGDYTPEVCDENTIFYVDRSATGPQDGVTWGTAYRDLNYALYEACPNSQIRIAEGIYYPSDTVALMPTPSDSNSFVLTHSYQLIGGFPSGGAELEARNPALYPTILSGDLNNDQMPSLGDAHTVVYVNAGVQAILDGLIIQHGYSFTSGIGLKGTRGAAIYNRLGEPTIINCIFRENHASSAGAAFYQLQGTSEMINCLFYDNVTNVHGGAIYGVSGGIDIVNCTFTNNSAINTGGAIYSYGNSGYPPDYNDLTITNSIFKDNTAGTDNNVYTENTTGASIVNNSMFDQASLPVHVTGSNNIFNADPNFVDPTSDNFAIQSTSTAIDMGDNSKVPADLTKDLNNEPRLNDSGFSGNSTVDMGAYELANCDNYTTATHIYVDESVTTGLVGLTWADAFDNLQEALQIATTCAVDSISVAEGEYLPDFVSHANERDSRFNIPANMKMFGGFPTGGGTWAERNWESNPTILSGDMGNDDNLANNAYTIVYTKNVADDVLVDGFIIQEANANLSEVSERARGGGWYNEANGFSAVSNPTIKNCVFQNSEAIAGAGLFNYATNLGATNPIVENCVFTNNISQDGGAIYDYANLAGTISNSHFINCQIDNNQANRSGGGLYLYGKLGGQNLTSFTNCTMVDNMADNDNNGSGNGGAIHSNTTGSGLNNHQIKNSILWDNTTAGVKDQITHLDGTAITKISNSILGGNALDSLIDFSADTSLIDLGNNWDVYPNFLDTAANDFNLKYPSLAINAGKNTDNLSTFDLSEKNRIIKSFIDIGAYEFNFEFPCGVYADLSVNEIPIAGTTYRAIGLIDSKGIVDLLSDGEVIFESQTSILLNPEFEVKIGELFEAKVDDTPCP